MATTAVDKNQVASAFLKHLGAPDTADNRKAVLAWLAQENSTILGNNPWNITTIKTSVKPCSYRTSSKGYTFAVYCTLDDGIKAAAEALQIRDYRGYAQAGDALKAGNATGFLDAIARSKWSGASHYGLGANLAGTNKLLSIYKRLGGGGTVNVASVGGPVRGTAQTGGALSQTVPIPALSGFGNLVSFPTGHILTTADVDTIIDALKKGDPSRGIAATDFGIIDPTTGRSAAEAGLRKVLLANVGKSWDKSLQDSLQSQLADAATAAAKLPEPLASIGTAIGNVVDPGFWARILALIAGSALVGFGVIRLATR